MVCVEVSPTVYGTIRQTVWVCLINCMNFRATLRCSLQRRDATEKLVSAIGLVAVTADFFCFEGGGGVGVSTGRLHILHAFTGVRAYL